ncbi:MAG: hypothetical protein WBB85_07385, partial [Albidovulum sp.]|uniref:hypothetical protein n=1 Tax=Albidovulum sp. TaxID=1872424 RepID=UPI003C901171
LEQRLKGRAETIRTDEPPAPTGLLVDPSARHDPIPPRPFLAERLRYATPNSADYRMLLETRKTGLDLDRYEAAWHELSRVTDALRTRIEDGQCVVSPPESPFRVIRQDARGLPESGVAALIDGVRARIEQMACEANPDPAVVALIQLDGDEAACFYSFDQRVIDPASIEFLALRCRRIYEGNYDPKGPFHLADYRRTEDAWLASVEGQDARRHWERQIARTPGRLLASDLFVGPTGETGYGYICGDIARDTWTGGQRIARQFGVSELVMTQVVFNELMAHLSGRSRFAYESRSFQRFPLDPDIYELLGQFTLGQPAGRFSDDELPFVERVRAEQDRADRSAAFAFFDAASLWQADDDRGGKIVYSNTCNRFEEFVLAGNVPPLRWFGDYLGIELKAPDTALEYVLVENAGVLENHWFISRSHLSQSWAETAHKLLRTTLEALCDQPDLWQATDLFADRKVAS